MEPAGSSQEGTERPLINPDQGFCNVAHCFMTSLQSACRLARNSPFDAQDAPSRALTTKSSPGNSC